MIRKYNDYEVDVLDANGKTYTYTVRNVQTTSAAVKKALKLHGPTATWAGNVRQYQALQETKETMMATRKHAVAAKRRSAPKGKGGSSGGGNPRNDGRITETQHEDAMRVLRAEYYQGVRSIAEEVANLVKNEGMDEGDALHQTVDGSYWVIYTHANFQVLMCSDHHDAYSEEFGEAPVSGADINWAALAYAAMARDVSEQVSSGDLDEAPRVRSRRAGRPPARRRR